MKQAHPPRARRMSLVCTLIAALCACETDAPNSTDAAIEPGVFTPTRDGPENAPADSCWGKTLSPAVVERVSEQIQITPAEVNPDGTIAKLPTYRTQDRQIIVTPRKNNWFETPCPGVLTVEFISSLQRAMRARGDYAGEITGQMDTNTREAIQVFQRQSGTDSGVLSLETARALGLIAVERSTLD